MKVMMSLKPKHAEKIFSGEKDYEFRKRIWKEKDVDTVIVYVSYPVKKVIGEFEVKDMIQGAPDDVWAKSHKPGISKKNFDEYFQHKRLAFGIKVGKVTKYKEEKKLKDFGMETVPQIFTYIREKNL